MSRPLKPLCMMCGGTCLRMWDHFGEGDPPVDGEDDFNEDEPPSKDEAKHGTQLEGEA